MLGYACWPFSHWLFCYPYVNVIGLLASLGLFAFGCLVGVSYRYWAVLAWLLASLIVAFQGLSVGWLAWPLLAVSAASAI